MKQVQIKAKNIKVGDQFDGMRVVRVNVLDTGRTSFFVLGPAGGWRRRPNEEVVTVERVL